ncbi:hypothetical protein EJB05_44115, partial [Eragrostis curvula]
MPRQQQACSEAKRLQDNNTNPTEAQEEDQELKLDIPVSWMGRIINIRAKKKAAPKQSSVAAASDSGAAPRIETAADDGLGLACCRSRFSSSTVSLSVRNDFSRTSSSMPVSKSMNGSEMVPGLAPPKAEKARASPLPPALYCQCTMPLGNTNMSPACSACAYTVPLRAASTRPTSSVPCVTSSSSDARGWMCGGFTAPGP